MCSYPASCSSTKARCRIGLPTATPLRQRLTCQAVLRVTQTLVLCFINYQWLPPEVASRFGTPPADAFTIAPALVQPTSIGSIRLASGNFQDGAVIDGNYLGTDHDFAAVERAIEAAREIGNQHAFDSLRESELIPGPKASAEEIRELARLASASFGHAVGTCKMGVDNLAVVDPELRVHGIVGLRVADASVMPRIITGPGTNASTHMIAGRAAKQILG